MNALMVMDLAIEDESVLHGRTFKITKKRWLAVEWLHGRRTRFYLESD